MLSFLFKVFLFFAFFIILKRVVKRILINTLQKGLLWTLKNQNPHWKVPNTKANKQQDSENIIDICPNCGSLSSPNHICHNS